MRILAIDPGTKLGWARNVETDMIVTGKLDLSGSRYDSSAMRYLRFREWLHEVSAGDPTLYDGPLDRVDLIAYEEVRNHQSSYIDPKTGMRQTRYATDAAHFYGGLQAILLAFCEDHQIPCEAIPVGTWKKHLTGKGNASKETYRQCALTRVANRSNRPEESIKLSEDEAAAVGILLAAQRIHGRATAAT
jgi:hypothetical protein